MIAKVMRGRKVGGLLRYLYGPGKANEHVDPHLVASWDDAPASLEPAWLAGRHDLRHLAGLLEQPLAASVRTPQRPVWHCAVRTAPTDRRLTDAQWRDVARDIVARTGLAPAGDGGGCRWVAVRHGGDHIHLVVTLARQDGRPARTSNDFYRVGEACRAAEQRLGLRATAPRDRTAAKRATRGEQEKGARSGRREPARATLQREVRTAAAAAATPDEFLARLTESGLLVRPRFSDRDPAVITGYAVAVPGDRAGDGRPVWFGGGKLAADLSWPKLATRWATGDQAADATRGRPGGRAGGRLSGQARQQMWRDAATLAAEAATEVRQLAATNPAAAAGIAGATADALSVTARVVEGRQGGPLTAASEAFDRAGRELHGRIPRQGATGQGLRAVARLLAMSGRAGRDETAQVVALVANLAALADAIAHLKDVQRRAGQAGAARAAAGHLRRAGAHPTARRPPTAGVVPTHPLLAGVIHRSARPPTTTQPDRRRVKP